MKSAPDAYAKSASRHFNQLMTQYGAPIFVLNLVKTREKRKRESVLSEAYRESIDYLNQFMDPDFRIRYIEFDMARARKRRGSQVFSHLAKIARQCVRKVGIFHSKADACVSKADAFFAELKGHQEPGFRLQTGVVRSNCIDCLDRTNTAQFAISKCALEHQLFAMGITEACYIDLESHCCKMLEVLYEDMGDIIALQYGGSQLVHNIESYRQTNAWVSHSRDMMRTLSRYYSNNFSDVDKQFAMSVFLGTIRFANETECEHVDSPTLPNKLSASRSWWDPQILDYLPLPTIERNFREITEPERIDLFYYAHRAFTYIAITDIFVPPPPTYRIGTGDPFTNSSSGLSNGQMGTNLQHFSSTDDSSSSSSASDTDDIEILDISIIKGTPTDEHIGARFENIFADSKQTYNMELLEPTGANLKMYKDYIFGHSRDQTVSNMSVLAKTRTLRSWNRVPTVSKEARLLYEKCIRDSKITK